MRMQQNESLHVAIGPNVKVLSDGKSLHTQGYHRVGHAVRRKNYVGSITTFDIHIRRSHLVYAQVES